MHHTLQITTEYTRKQGAVFLTANHVRVCTRSQQDLHDVIVAVTGRNGEWCHRIKVHLKVGDIMDLL